jgi:hypothetical protein
LLKQSGLLGEVVKPALPDNPTGINDVNAIAWWLVLRRSPIATGGA